MNKEKGNGKEKHKEPNTWLGKKIELFRSSLAKKVEIRKKEKQIRLKKLEKIRQERKHMMRRYLEKAGLNIPEEKITKLLFNSCIAVNLFISAYLIYFFAVSTEANFFYIIFIMILVWVVIFFGVLFIIWLLFYLMLDFRIFQRKASIEDVLADFLQLTSANIRAGMAIDKALWFSVRPRFGVLANEIEIVAKETISGKELEKALMDFTKKYDSSLLKRSMHLFIEGLKAGGEVGELLNRISANISESRLMRKEMSANVTTYVIFISFATVVAAPVLFALSNQLLLIVGNLVTTISRPSDTAAGGLGGAFSTIAVQPGDFIFFAVLMLIITSLFSGCIVAIINKGSIRGGIKYIPSFMAVSVVLFFIANFILSRTLGGVII